MGSGILHDSEDDISLIPNVRERNRSDHHDHEIEDPVGTSGGR